MIHALLAITATGHLGACDSSRSSNGRTSIERDGAFLTSDERTLLSTVADQILPRTDTLGAVEAGVPDVIDALLADWADAPYRQRWRLGLADLAIRLQGDANAPYHTLAEDLRAKALSILDAESYDASPDVMAQKTAFYPELKYLVCTAYYMSRRGATEELRYQHVPGIWAPCVPFEAGDRAWATSSG